MSIPGLPILPVTENLYKFVALSCVLVIIACAIGMIAAISYIDRDLTQRKLELAANKTDSDRRVAEFNARKEQFDNATRRTDALLTRLEALKRPHGEITDLPASERAAAVRRWDEEFTRRMSETESQLDQTRAQGAALILEGSSDAAVISGRAGEILERLKRDDWLSKALIVPWIVVAVIVAFFALPGARWGFREWRKYQRMQDVVLESQYHQALEAEAARRANAIAPAPDPPHDDAGVGDG